MGNESLILMAAGRSSRFGRDKPLEPLGPGGASLTAYTVFDALRAGFGRVILVTRPSLRAPLQGHLEEHLGPDLPLDWVYQDVDAVPEAHRSLAAPRSKPWGTAHAVWSCRGHIPGAFGVANGDDWYGPEALAALLHGLRDLPRSRPCPGVLVGFPMATTLPPGGGGVSRGWVQARDGTVTGVLELGETARTPGPGAGGALSATGAPIIGLDPEGRTVTVPDDAWASMNLWGFGACVLPLLASAFGDFLTRKGGDPDAEFALSSAVDSLIADDALALRLVAEGRRWFGITHPGDVVWVRDRLRELHADGTYPGAFAGPLREIRSRLAP